MKNNSKEVFMYLAGLALLSTTIQANFNFNECSGSGTFEQHIVHYGGDYEKVVLVGEIPKGIEGLQINLISDKDVDIRLYGEDEDKIVHWSHGIHNQANEKTKAYRNVPVTYSGYNGVNGEQGHEFIKVEGTTPTVMRMKAFGYQAGYATVNYSWTGKVGCKAQSSGKGSFSQTLEKKASSLVGTLPPGVKNVQINLTSDKDLDIQLFAQDGTAIASWKPKGIMAGANEQSIVYENMNITWSGYNGSNGQKGHEYINISNTTSQMLVLKVYGYEAGVADVTYSWGLDFLWNFIEHNKSPVVAQNAIEASDEVNYAREYQHGIDILQRGKGNFLAIWASAEDCLIPKGENSNGEWTHDICAASVTGNIGLNPHKIIDAPLAQEPASAAINSVGHIMITMEDASYAGNELAQTYGVYNKDMTPIKSYQNVVLGGGHSGHVASVGDKFAVFYSEEWVDGGGVGNLGSGKDVWLTTYDSNGDMLKEHNLSGGKYTRDWWPLVAGSEDKEVMMLWQRFVDGKTYAHLMISVYDVDANRFIKKDILIQSKIKYYTYDIQYLKDIHRFLITGEKFNGGGFVLLLDTQGNIIVRKDFDIAISREAQPAIKSLNKGEVKVVYPALGSKLLALSVSRDNVILEGKINIGFQWQISGSDGIFLENNDIYFMGLSIKGVKEMKVRLYMKE